MPLNRVPQVPICFLLNLKRTSNVDMTELKNIDNIDNFECVSVISDSDLHPEALRRLNEVCSNDYSDNSSENNDIYRSMNNSQNSNLNFVNFSLNNNKNDNSFDNSTNYNDYNLKSTNTTSQDGGVVEKSQKNKKAGNFINRDKQSNGQTSSHAHSHSSRNHCHSSMSSQSDIRKSLEDAVKQRRSTVLTPTVKHTYGQTLSNTNPKPNPNSKLNSNLHSNPNPNPNLFPNPNPNLYPKPNKNNPNPCVNINRNKPNNIPKRNYVANATNFAVLSYDIVSSFLRSNPIPYYIPTRGTALTWCQRAFIHQLDIIKRSLKQRDFEQINYDLQHLHALPTLLFGKKSSPYIIAGICKDILANNWKNIDSRIANHGPIASRKYNPNSTESGKFKRAGDLISSGKISKGIQYLNNPSPPAVTDSVINNLSKLHPTRVPLDKSKLPIIHSDRPFVFKSSAVLESIRKIKKGTAPGISSLRSENLMDLIGLPTDSLGNDFLESFTSFLNLIANYSLPQVYYDFLAEAKLIPIPKDSSNVTDVRPIALPEIFSKIVGNMLQRILSKEIRKAVGPFQFGCGYQFATEAIIHATNQHLDRENIDIGMFDLENAFNKADRETSLINILNKIPALYPFARAMYINPSKLWIQHSNGSWKYILSSQGSRQGDPIVGVIFNFAILPLLEQINIAIKNTAALNRQDVGKLFAYYDDLTFCAPIEQQISAIKIISNLGPKFGLFIKPKKCSILLGPRESRDIAIQDKRYYLNLLPDSLCHIHYSNNREYLCQESSLSATAKYGTKLLGTPIGSESFIRNWLKDKLAEVEKEILSYRKLKSYQQQWLALIYSFKGKFNYLYRTVNFKIMKDYAQDFGTLMSNNIGFIINISNIRWDEPKIWLPITQGGMGIGYQTYQCLCANLASNLSAFQFLTINNIMVEGEFDFTVLNTVSSCYQFVSKYPMYDEFSFPENFNEFQDKCTVLEFNVWKNKYLSDGDIINNSQKVYDNVLQHTLYDEILQEYVKQYETDVIPNEEKSVQQWYYSSSYVHAGKFLLAIPVIPPLCMGNVAFANAIKSRLRIPHFPDHPHFKCDCFRNTFIDEHGDHLVKCVKNSTLMQIRHHAMVRALSKLASDAGVFNVVEPRRALSDDSNKRPDIILYNSYIHQGATVAIDVSITHPISEYLSLKPGAASTVRDKQKIKKYEAICDRENMEFQGFIFETYGKFNANVDRFVKKCCEKIALIRGSSYSTLKHQWVTRLSTILQTSNSYFLIKGYHRLLDTNSLEIDHEYVYDTLPVVH